MTRWSRRMTFQSQLTAVVDAGVRSAAGGRQYRDLHRLPHLSRSRSRSEGTDRRGHRAGIVHRRRRHPPARAAQGGARQRASTPTSSSRSSTPMDGFGCRRRRSAACPPLVSPDHGAGRPRRSGARSVTVVDRRASRPRGRAPARARARQRYAVLVGLFRDQIDAHLSRLAWVLVAVWVAGLGSDRRRSATGSRRARSRRSSASRGAPHGSPGRVLRADSIRRPARTRSAR